MKLKARVIQPGMICLLRERADAIVVALHLDIIANLLRFLFALAVIRELSESGINTAIKKRAAAPHL